MNLKRLYGNVYQVKVQTIPGKAGTISVHAPGILQVTTEDATVAERLAALSGVGKMHDGSLIFAPAAFDSVAALVLPRKKRRRNPLSPEAKARLAKIGMAHRFRSPAGAGSTLRGPETSADTAA